MNASQLITYLHRGGQYGYFWRSTDRRSRYYRVGEDPRPATAQANIYFGVHPVSVQRPPHERGRIDDVCAINCLFAEFDCKDFGGTKEAIKAHLQARAMCWPTVIVDSGGGWHCYWLLDQPHPIASADSRKRIAELQARFVVGIGADVGAKDLARVLRVPGTVNAKYDPPRPVHITEEWTGNAIWKLDEMVRWVSHMEAKFAPVDFAPPATAHESIIQQFNRQHRPGDILTRHGYTLSRDGTRFTRPGKDARQGISGTIVEVNGKETVYTFSSNDPLFVVCAGHRLDAFDLFVALEHGGNRSAALHSAAQQLERPQLTTPAATPLRKRLRKAAFVLRSARRRVEA